MPIQVQNVPITPKWLHHFTPTNDVGQLWWLLNVPKIWNCLIVAILEGTERHFIAVLFCIYNILCVYWPFMYLCDMYKCLVPAPPQLGYFIYADRVVRFEL